MPYDRDSFLAGLAVGRTLWRPHRDNVYSPPPGNYDLIAESTGILGRWQLGPASNVLAEKNNSPGINYYHYQYDGTTPSSYRVDIDSYGNTTGMFNVFVPSRYRKLYFDVEATGQGSPWGPTYYNISGIYLRDAYGINGYYNNSFTGAALKSVYLCYAAWTAEQINAQTGVVINSTSPYSLTRQIVEIDISDIDEDIWVGLHRCDNSTTFYSIEAGM